MIRPSMEAYVTCDTMLLPDKYYLYAYDVVTNEAVFKKARENYDQTIQETMRSAGHDNDDKDLD